MIKLWQELNWSHHDLGRRMWSHLITRASLKPYLLWFSHGLCLQTTLKSLCLSQQTSWINLLLQMHVNYFWVLGWSNVASWRSIMLDPTGYRAWFACSFRCTLPTRLWPLQNGFVHFLKIPCHGLGTDLLTGAYSCRSTHTVVLHLASASGLPHQFGCLLLN